MTMEVAAAAALLFSRYTTDRENLRNLANPRQNRNRSMVASMCFMAMLFNVVFTTTHTVLHCTAYLHVKRDRFLSRDAGTGQPNKS